MKLLYKTSDNDEIYLENNTVIVKFSKNKNAISSSFLNGSYQENLNVVFNHDITDEIANNLKITEVESYLIDLCNKLNLDYKTSSGLITTAKMSSTSIKNFTYRNIEVIAITTAGVRVNANRAGESATYYEENNEFDLNIGTINSIILINGSLSKDILTNALITATEAKTTILQDLRIPSIYSEGFATGTGTDGTIIVSNKSSNISFSNAGKHSKLGELIAKAVIESIRESLSNQLWLTATSQCDVLVRINKLKFDINEFYNSIDYNKLEFLRDLRIHKSKIKNVAICSSILNLIEESNLNLITFDVAYDLSCEILKNCDDYTVFELLNFIIQKYLSSKL